MRNVCSVAFFRRPARFTTRPAIRCTIPSLNGRPGVFPGNNQRASRCVLHHRRNADSKRADGKKLQDFAEIILDTGAPPGDAMVTVPGLDEPVAPASTIGGCLLVNGIKAEVAARLEAAGHPPLVLTAPALVGAARSSEIFEAAYDEHARRLAKLYSGLGP